jgi:AcrR family transcriptional regulator
VNAVAKDGERERLVTLAMEIVAERGGAGLTLANLAHSAAVSEPALARWFPDQEALLEAMVERWFVPLTAAMDEVMAADLPPRRRMYEFFARRFALNAERYRADPIAFGAYEELGARYFHHIQGYIDLADHYLSEIIGEAMADGHFAGLEVDQALSLVNQMVSPYLNTGMFKNVLGRLNEDKLAMIVDAIFDGLSAENRGAKSVKGLRAA